MKNMKIEINNEQPINEVVADLDRLGYLGSDFCYEIRTKFISTYDDGTYSNYQVECDALTLTTLAELKEM